MIYDAVNNFIGEIEQYPPIFSALKKDGKRLYEFARSGTSVNIEPRKVAIQNLKLPILIILMSLLGLNVVKALT